MPVALNNALLQIKPEELAFLRAEREWVSVARQKQVLPVDGWNLGLALSGRGFGKTKMGAAWVRRCVGLYPGCVVHVVAPTYSDLRGVIFGGLSGLVASLPAAMIRTINHSLFEIHLVNGSVIKGFSAEAPDRLRGPQCHFLWGDELAAWGHTAEEMLVNIDMSTRLVYRLHPRGTTGRDRLIQPQRFYTSTPKPLQWLKKMTERRNVLLVHGSTLENRANLAAGFIAELEQYRGTAIYKQEVLGQLIDIGEAAIIRRSWLRIWPKNRPIPYLEFVFASFDTALTEKTFDKKTFDPDFTACSVWGVFIYDNRYHMMLLDCWHDRLGMPELIMRAKKELAASYGRKQEVVFRPLIGAPQVLAQNKKLDLIIIEDKGSGISLRQMLANEGIDTYGYNPGNADKLARLHAVSHVAAAGRIWLPESAHQPGQPRSWIVPMLDEVCVYSGPGTTKHDDFVDSFSQGARYFADNYLNTGVNQLVRDATRHDDDDPDALYVDASRYQSPTQGGVYD